MQVGIIGNPMRNAGMLASLAHVLGGAAEHPRGVRMVYDNKQGESFAKVFLTDSYKNRVAFAFAVREKCVDFSEADLFNFISSYKSDDFYVEVI